MKRVVGRKCKKGRSGPASLVEPGTVIARFDVVARPRAWRAPTVTRSGASFKDADLVAWQETVALFARVAMAGKKPYGGPVGLTIAVRLAERPGSFPDLTNVVKATEDACQGIVIENDRQVASLDATRTRGKVDGVTIVVTAL